jgi:NADH-quinone oxidoreductase subunit G
MSENRLTMTEPSLNPPSQEMVNVTINGVQVQAPKGENVIEAAKRAGVDIPYFCYHPRLSKGDAANCRMCLVEISTPRKNPDGSVVLVKDRKPAAACTLPVSEGMVVDADSDQVVKDRRGVLEFLLINHPLDCPICDRGGECPLQNNTLFYGPATSRYIEEKRHFPKAYPLSDYVVFDRERCIHCARCTRFTEDISGDSQLGFLKRGADMEVGTFAHTAYQSKFSGNVIELCPVGALLSRTYRFKARPWDLHSQRSVCSKCSNGCNIKIDYRLGQLQRVNARLNEAVNEEWTCDKGKFGHDYVSSEARLQQPMLKRDGAWTPISWNEAYTLLGERLKGVGSRVGGIGGARLTNEDNFAFQKLFRETLKSNNLDSRTGRYGGPTNRPIYERFGFHGMGNAIADLEKMKSILVIGSDLADEQPIIFLRVRKAWRYGGASVVNAVTSVQEDTVRVGDFAAEELVYRPGTEIALLNGLLNVLFAENLLPATPALNLTALKREVAEWTPARTAQETGVTEAQITTAARLLARGPMAILAGKTITEHPYYPEVAAALGNLLAATGNANNLNIPGAECNSQGALDMGVVPDMGPGYTPLAQPGMNTQQMLEAAANGSLDLLWIVGADLVAKYHDPDLVRRALGACSFVVVSELAMTETAELATLVLPAASLAEKDGTYTNCERRVQRIFKAFDIAPQIKPDWLIFTEVANQLTGAAPYFTARDILREIAAKAPIYGGITPKSVSEGGVRWSYPESAAKSPSVATVTYRAPARAAVGAAAPR